jgi:DNA primase
VIVPQDVLDEIRSRVDLVDLVSSYVPLKRAGERWKGLCPFHQEKTPSFTVNPKLGIFHCFGCHAGGDAFEFLKRHDRLDFPEAVRALAERTGVALPDRPGPPPEAGAREGLYRLLDWAARRYEAWLWEGEAGDRARRYLAERGVTTETARAFRLGAAPEGWDHLLGAARREGYAVEALVGAGLASPRQNASGHYDRFRGRLLFPIADSQGRVIAFGGRALVPGDEPKYLNSPETPLYQKGQTLYALHLARDRMAVARRALLVEGYIDSLMAHQHGFTETVAVCGTALTPAHLGLLRRYADELILFFDADRAGVEAARRAEELLEQSADPHWWALDRRRDGLGRPGLRLRVATLAAGHDPDTFLRAEGHAAFEARCAAARNLLLYAMDRIFAEEDTASARGKTTGVARVALLLSKVQDADEAIELGREAARHLGVDPSDLWLQAQRLQGAPRRAGAASGRSPAVPAADTALAPFDSKLLRLLLQVPAARPTLLELADPQDVAHPGLREILAVLRAHPDAEPSGLMGRLEAESTRAWMARLLVEEATWTDPAADIAAMASLLELRRRRRQARELARAIATAETKDVKDLQTALSRVGRLIPDMTAPNPHPTEDLRP